MQSRCRSAPFAMRPQPAFVTSSFDTVAQLQGRQRRCACCARQTPRVSKSVASSGNFVDPDDGQQEPISSPLLNRREVLAGAAGAAAAGAVGGATQPADARFLGEIFKGEGKDVFQRTSFIYDVDESDLRETTYDSALSRLASSNLVFLGDHRNSLADHLLAARLIRELRNRRGKVAVALQEVQHRFQPALDSYVQGRIREDKLYKITQWRTRSTAAFDNFLGIFWVCRRFNVPLVAVNAETEVLDKVRAGGLRALDMSERRRTVIDPEGFAKSLNDAPFRVYEKSVIAPAFNVLSGMGMLGKQPDPKNYFSSRVLCDETIATNIVQFMQTHPDTLVIALMDTDRIKFQLGVPSRVARISHTLGMNDLKIKSVLLNLTTNETGIDSRTNSMRTSYEVPASNPDQAKQVLPLCDLVWYANPANINPSNRRTRSIFF